MIRFPWTFLPHHSCTLCKNSSVTVGRRNPPPTDAYRDNDTFPVQALCLCKHPGPCQHAQGHNSGFLLLFVWRRVPCNHKVACSLLTCKYVFCQHTLMTLLGETPVCVNQWKVSKMNPFREALRASSHVLPTCPPHNMTLDSCSFTKE